MPVLQELGELRSTYGVEKVETEVVSSNSKQTGVCLNTFKHSTVICALPYSCISKIGKILNKVGRTTDSDPQTVIDKYKIKCKYKQPKLHLKLNLQAC